MELSSRARAFSVEALIGHTTSSDKVNEEIHDDDLKAIRVELCAQDLWEQFHSLGTEMIVTKAGRRMFPAIKVRITGMNPTAYYILFLDIVPVDEHRYRYGYCSSQWTVASQNETGPILDADQQNDTNRRRYIHPESPATGQLWMTQDVIAFDRLKLTNNRHPLVQGQVSLLSMHKYIPRVNILVTRHLDLPIQDQINLGCMISIQFPVTTFLTVTAYQNQQITRLKIASNPFAKGFRERSRDEIKYSASSKEEDDEWKFPHWTSQKRSMDSSILRPYHAPVRILLPKPMNSSKYIIRPWIARTFETTKTTTTNFLQQ